MNPTPQPFKPLSEEMIASFNSLEGLPEQPPPPPDPTLPWHQRLRARVSQLTPGLSVAILVALAASWLADHYKAPVMLFALLIGMAVNFFGQDARCRPGIDFAGRQVLRLGVALLGARITLEQVQSLGAPVLLIATGGVVITILAGWGLARALNLRSEFGVLTGGAVAICGASAALAVSSVLPHSETRERDTILTVVGVTTLSTIAMVIYPALSTALGFSNVQAGIFLGATIHDVAQVVGAGYTVSKETGDTATIVKMFRVALLLPAIIVIAFLFSRTMKADEKVQRPPLVPIFLIGFVALLVLNSTPFAPKPVMAAFSEASRWLLIVAIAAVGTKTSLGQIAQVGWRPVALIVLESAVILGWVMAGIAVMAVV